jgi:hypothetical protein
VRGILPVGSALCNESYGVGRGATGVKEDCSRAPETMALPRNDA